MKKNKLQTSQIFQKKSCDHSEIVFDSNAGEQLCRKCGVVLVEKMVDFVSELHFRNNQNSRVGPKSSLKIHDRGLSTDIGNQNKDSSGNPLPYEMKNSLNRMRLWDSRSKNNTTGKRNLKIALIEMKKLAEKMSLSDMILERASYFYRKVSDKGLIKGRSVRAAVGACIHAACRDLGTNRTLKEIAKNIHESKKKISKTYRVIFQNLEFEIPRANITNIIVRLSNNAGISEKTKRDSLLIYEKLNKKTLVMGKKPNAVAATVIYMAAIRKKENMSQRKLAEIAEIPQI
ncbi:MAG: transcription initiation factor IIB, partial [Nitrosopumilaceae archaeon]